MSNVIEFKLNAKDNASKIMGRMARVVKNITKSIAALAISVAAYVGTMIAFSKRVATIQDEAGKFALKIGKTVENVTRMQFAAKLSGIQVRTFNMAVQRMERRLGEAAQGTGEALGALRDLGIEAKSFANLPLDEQLSQLSDKFASMTDGSTALRTAFKLFDSEGVVMLQMLKGGSAAMQEMAKEAERLGLVVSAQAAANATKFKDTLTKLSGAVDGASRMLSDTFLPAMTGVADKLAEMVVDNKEAVVGFFTSMTLGAITFAIMAKGAFDTVNETLTSAFDNISFDNLVAGAGNALGWIIEAVGPFIIAFVDIIQKGLLFVWDAFVSLGGSALGILIGAAGTWVAGFAEIIVGSFQVIWDSFVSLGKGAWDAVTNLFSNTPQTNIMDTLFGNIEADTAAARDKVMSGLSTLGAVASVSGTTLIDNMIGDTAAAQAEFAESVGSMADLAVTTGTRVGDSVGTMLEDAMLTAGTQATELMTSLELMGEIAEESGKSAASGLGNVLDAMELRYGEFMKANKSVAEQIGLELHNTLISTIAGVSDAVAQSIVQGENLLDALKAVAEQVLQSIISMLIQVGIQRLIAAAIGVKGAAIQGSAELGVQSAIAYANGFNASAALGIVGLAAAPAVGAAASATMIAGAVSSKAAGVAVGAAHGGLDFVPSEQTVLLDQGERIVSPNQNRDLTSFLDGGGSNGGGGGGVRIESISILPNATNAQAFLDMPDADMRRIVEEKIIKALDDLDRVGVRQNNIQGAA